MFIYKEISLTVRTDNIGIKLISKVRSVNKPNLIRCTSGPHRQLCKCKQLHKLERVLSLRLPFLFDIVGVFSFARGIIVWVIGTGREYNSLEMFNFMIIYSVKIFSKHTKNRHPGQMLFLCQFSNKYFFKIIFGNDGNNSKICLFRLKKYYSIA